MRIFLTLSLAALAVGCTAAADGPTELSANAQTRLADELRGRVAGPTVSCVSQRDLRGNRSVGEEAIVFNGRTANIVYVNRPPAGCPQLKAGRALITRTTSTQLCRGDIATVLDTASGIEFGSCGLGDFTPYRRVRS
jgi:hypothetical protein